ncbi:dihydrolipoamide acetyltransferase family protein [Fictibacillus phosphorivorans]|uniref:dihydrolipoamide acetyltransferase family protein n=1 Tax=Fictibacillus phosphorivorans TaxID=1221500 RepID=UPI00203CEC39|nr:dihydrolipoamide acetyltransferase family protein [Fictibacillus phosphorivorans]MCM3717443.1 2-oxo acid dehydrogenase subunit E2 [Fictibacillus phosphorivorans]MCM3775138.1 2-oxo acid dehydrogenase subunit E2 [Fictibacillus phosphorivorans]
MVEVKLHDIGEGMHEGEVIHFFVKTGDKVKVDQPLVEVQTDKVTAELPSPAAGTIKDIKVKEGDVVTVGSVILTIEASSSAAPSNQKTEEQTNVTTQPVVDKIIPSKNTVFAGGISTLNKRVLAAPFTRKIARENGVDIEQIVGTGPGGRVTDQDVYNFIENGSALSAKEDNTSKTVDVRHSKVPSFHSNEAEEIPFKGRRKQIAKKMVQSLATIPHVTHFEEIDVTAVMDLKKQLKAMDPENKRGMNVSVAAFFVKAIQIALKDFPIFNAKLDEEKEVIRLEKNVNIGIATDSDEGLIVPVISHVEQRNVRDIARDMKDKITRAKTNKLKGSDMTGGTFTISNVGPLGSIAATPIINHPEVALMAFHKTKKTPVVVGDDIVIRSMMNVSMSFDHRVADGATAVMFTNRVKELIENPYFMTLELI